MSKRLEALENACWGSGIYALANDHPFNTRPTHEHARRYHDPGCSEGAAKMPFNENEGCSWRFIAFCRWQQLKIGNEDLDTISNNLRCSDLLGCVFRFSEGLDGWCPKRRVGEELAASRNTKTPTMSYPWYLFQCKKEFSLCDQVS